MANRYRFKLRSLPARLLNSPDSSLTLVRLWSASRAICSARAGFCGWFAPLPRSGLRRHDPACALSSVAVTALSPNNLWTNKTSSVHRLSGEALEDSKAGIGDVCIVSLLACSWPTHKQDGVVAEGSLASQLRDSWWIYRPSIVDFLLYGADGQCMAASRPDRVTQKDQRQCCRSDQPTARAGTAALHTSPPTLSKG